MAALRRLTVGTQRDCSSGASEPREARSTSPLEPTSDPARRRLSGCQACS